MVPRRSSGAVRQDHRVRGPALEARDIQRDAGAGVGAGRAGWDARGAGGCVLIRSLPQPPVLFKASTDVNSEEANGVDVGDSKLTYSAWILSAVRAKRANKTELRIIPLPPSRINNATTIRWSTAVVSYTLQLPGLSKVRSLADARCRHCPCRRNPPGTNRVAPRGSRCYLAPA